MKRIGKQNKVRSTSFTMLCFWLLLLLPTLLFQSAYAHHDTLHVTYLDPCGSKAEEACPYWDDVRQYINKAASDLNITLESYQGILSRFKSVEDAHKVSRSSSHPDFLLYPLFEGQSGYNTLKIAERAKIKSFIFSSNIPHEVEALVGKPRKTFKHWIGHLYTDNRDIGANLIKRLVAKKEKETLALSTATKPYHVIALGGKYQNGDSDERIRGLNQVVNTSPNLILHQLVRTDWSEAQGYFKAKGLMKRYQPIDIVWGANDQVILGALKAVKEQGLTPGKDIVLGGVNWSTQGVSAVRKGEVSVIAGGQAIIGALALIQIYDYHHGIDFSATDGNTQVLKMGFLTPDNLDKQLNVLRSFYQSNFKIYTKTHNPAVKQYKLDFFTALNSGRSINTP